MNTALALALAPVSALVGNVYTVRAGISSVTGEPEVLAGLRVEITGHGGMVGELAVRLVDPVEQVARILAERDGWWTLDRVVEILGDDAIEFDRDALVA